MNWKKIAIWTAVAIAVGGVIYGGIKYYQCYKDSLDTPPPPIDLQPENREIEQDKNLNPIPEDTRPPQQITETDALLEARLDLNEGVN